MTKIYNNILIIKPSALGDIIHTLPALWSLRASFPAARISWLVHTGFAPILDCVAGLDEVIPFDRKRFGSWWYNPQSFREFTSFLSRLRQGGYDLVLDFQGLFRSGFFAYQTGSRTRFGMRSAREMAGIFYTHRISPPQSIHVIDYYNQMVSATGAGVIVTEVSLTPPTAAVESVQQKLAAAGITAGQPYAVLIPGSAHSHKCWPAERFAVVSDALTKEYGFKTVICGSKSELPLTERIVSLSGAGCCNFAGQTTLPELAALLSGAAGVLSNDTGPGHIAAAVNRRALIVYGSTNPWRLYPYGRPQTVVGVELDKRGSSIESSNPAFAITHVSVQMVLERIRQMIAGEVQ